MIVVKISADYRLEVDCLIGIKLIMFVNTVGQITVLSSAPLYLKRLNTFKFMVDKDDTRYKLIIATIVLAGLIC